MTTHAFDGHTPKIHPDAFVHPDTTIIGQATVGARSSIWPGTVLRADMQGSIVIAEDTSIQDGSVIHLTGGMSVTNARIGSGSLVGAGSLITAGTIIPPGSLVMGSPAKVIRPIKDKERNMIDGSWPIYVAYSRKYKAELGV